jgi:hypothetical protein
VHGCQAEGNRRIPFWKQNKDSAQQESVSMTHAMEVIDTLSSTADDDCGRRFLQSQRASEQAPSGSRIDGPKTNEIKEWWLWVPPIQDPKPLY